MMTVQEESKEPLSLEAFRCLSDNNKLRYLTELLDQDREERGDERPIDQVMVKKYLLRYAPAHVIYEAIVKIRAANFPIKTSLYAFLAANTDERIFSVAKGTCVFGKKIPESHRETLTPVINFPERRKVKSISEEDFIKLNNELKRRQASEFREIFSRSRDVAEASLDGISTTI